VSPRRFDLARNWALVEALLVDPAIDVEYLFISERLRDRLLEHAASIHAPADRIDRARRALRQPPRVPPHDDHLHLRIRCSAADRSQGCVDEGRVRLRSEVARARTS
jgi:penicillin-insensitive murein endopeptidase